MINYNKTENSIKAVFDNHPEIILCILYGSVVDNRLRSDSDIDVAVAAHERLLSDDERLNLYLELVKACGREIDLVDLNRTSGPVLHQICTQGKVLVKRNTTDYANILIRMLDETTDMTPNIRYVRQRRRERMLKGNMP